MCQPCQACTCNPGCLPPFCTPCENDDPDPEEPPMCFPSGSTERNCVECIAKNSDYTTSCSSCFNSSSHNYSRLEGNAPSDYEIPGPLLK